MGNFHNKEQSVDRDLVWIPSIGGQEAEVRTLHALGRCVVQYHVEPKDSGCNTEDTLQDTRNTVENDAS